MFSLAESSYQNNFPSSHNIVLFPVIWMRGKTLLSHRPGSSFQHKLKRQSYIHSNQTQTFFYHVCISL